MQQLLNKQKRFTRALVVFSMFFILWLAFIFLKMLLFDEEAKSWQEIAFHCTFMAIVFTVSFDWKDTKDLFKKEEE